MSLCVYFKKYSDKTAYKKITEKKACHLNENVDLYKCCGRTYYMSVQQALATRCSLTLYILQRTGPKAVQTGIAGKRECKLASESSSLMFWMM